MDGLFSRASTYVNFPCYNNSQNERSVGFASLAGFPQVQGAINCTHMAIREPPEQPGAFINCKRFCSINVQLVCNYKKRFIQICARFPGSCHDAFILRQSNIPNLFLPGNRLKGRLVGDKGYPLQIWFMTPVRNPTNETQACYNESHMPTRCVIEQAIGVLKMCFRCLDRSGGTLQYSPARVSRMIVVCSALHNIAQQQGLEVENDQGAYQSSSDDETIEEEGEEEEEDKEQFEGGGTHSQTSRVHCCSGCQG
ncbi:putative nuclease HARBI1 [Heptranchias perlo]|uniref:putative nuclease HARBI1 n=1 Tax=Heptranchias perlo TaxID=212740 RepID=UPI00355ACA9E